jgi:hypothetical protein
LENNSFAPEGIVKKIFKSTGGKTRVSFDVIEWAAQQAKFSTDTMAQF